jgi:sugar phosphate isomerase/epimerase
MNVGVVMEAFADRSLESALDVLSASAPGARHLELIAGGYGPQGHCDREALLGDDSLREDWQAGITARGFTVAALNAWGNPLHPDPAVAAEQDRALRETIRLAARLGVDCVVAMAGCPGAGPDDRTAPHFAAGGWLPDLEGVTEWQWDEVILPYWSDLAAFAAAEHPRLRVCIELHPGTCVNNVETFERLCGAGEAVAANLDPSHFFWQQMDTFSIIDRLGDRIGHAHAKDVRFNREQLALNGLLDRRWPTPPEDMPWTFAGVGEGHPPEWWQKFVDRLAGLGSVQTIAIEHEDPFTPPEQGVPQAAEILRPRG